VLILNSLEHVSNNATYFISHANALLCVTFPFTVIIQHRKKHNFIRHLFLNPTVSISQVTFQISVWFYLDENTAASLSLSVDKTDNETSAGVERQKERSMDIHFFFHYPLQEENIY
jgi:hypothetical protein